MKANSVSNREYGQSLLLYMYLAACAAPQVGINAYAEATDVPYSDTSIEGYDGIMVKSYSGDADCIQFISSTKGLAGMVGDKDTFGN